MPEIQEMTSKLRPDLAKTILKNTVFVTFGNIALKGLNFLFTVYVVRKLGDDEFGKYSIVTAFVLLFQIFAELGISQYVMREIARDRAKTRIYFWNLIALRVILAVIGIVGITIGAVLIQYNDDIVLGVFVFTFGFLLSAFHVPLENVLTAHEQMGYVPAANIAGQIALMLLGTILLYSGLGFVFLILAHVLSIVPKIGVTLWGIRKAGLNLVPITIIPSMWSTLIKFGLPFGVITLALTIDFSVDTFMLSIFEPENVAGWYNVAYGLVRALLFFFVGFSTAIVPSLSRVYVKDVPTVEKWYAGSIKFMLLTSLPLAVGGSLVAEPLTRFLYTDDFLPSAAALHILFWDVPMLMFASFFGQMTTIVAEERAAARAYVISAVANILLNLYAIPRFSYLGASVVTVITDLIVMAQLYNLIRRKVRLPPMQWVLIKIVAATAVMGFVVWLLGDTNLFLSIGVGVGVYVGLALALRLLDETELAFVQRLVARLRGLAKGPG